MQIQYGIKKIRPKVLFLAIEERFKSQNVGFKVNIPSSDIGGMTLLESSILVSILKLCNATRLFEFGTYMGATTLLLAENSSDESNVVTLDIPPEASTEDFCCDTSKILVHGDANDVFLRNRFQSQGAKCIRFSSDLIQKKIEQIYENSLTIDIEKYGWSEAFDYIFIDGGHDYATVEKDSRNAAAMLKQDGVILWHDFNSKIHQDVTRFINNESRSREFFHVENTMLVFELRGSFVNMLAL